MTAADDEVIACRLLRVAPSEAPFLDRDGAPTSYVIDTRGVVADPRVRGLIVDRIAERVRNRCDVVAGVSRSGVPWAAMVAERLSLPLAVVLEEPRRTGLKRAVEGDVAGRRVIVVDNFAKSGRSVLDARDRVVLAGATWVEALTIVATKNATRADIRSVYTFTNLIDLNASRLTAETIERLRRHDAVDGEGT